MKQKIHNSIFHIQNLHLNRKILYILNIWKYSQVHIHKTEHKRIQVFRKEERETWLPWYMCRGQRSTLDSCPMVS